MVSVAIVPVPVTVADPAFTARAPLKVLEPERTSAPCPDFVNPADPTIEPAISTSLRKVTALSPLKDVIPEALTFGDGSQVVSSAEHPWVVEERGKRTSGGFKWASRKLRTDELDPAQHCIKSAGPLQMPAVDLPLDPYALGVWLGDGARGTGVVSSSIDDIEPLRQELKDAGWAQRNIAGAGSAVVNAAEGIKGLFGQTDQNNVDRSRTS